MTKTRLLLLAVGLAIPVATRAQGPIAHWSFDAVEDTLVPDESGSGNDGRILSAELVKGVKGTALRFGSRTDEMRCEAAVNLDPTDTLTIEAWAKPDGRPVGGFPAVVRRDGAYALRFSGGRLGFLLWFDDTPIGVQTQKMDWTPGEWYHLVGVYDGSAMRIYVDGEPDPAPPTRASGPVDPSLTSCGVGALLGRYSFSGVIDEVRIYNRALSAEQIAASHQEGRDSLVAQADVTVEPQRIGAPKRVFRKPAREVNMVEDGFIWIDAEDFDDYGGWLLDTQFVHIMGSAYLIAAGVGTPVEDATTRVPVAAAGTYRLWARTKNWIPEHSPGSFRISINGETVDRLLGVADAEGWTWENVGDFELPAGDIPLALNDQTGYYGRCDALILTSDMAYGPPVEVEAIRAERARLTGISLAPIEMGEWDVIVVGAGAAGSVAALSAARMGARTALIQNRPVLGGNSSIENGVPINGAASLHSNARESGVIEEIGRIKARFGFPKMSEAFRKGAEGEGNLSVFLNQHVFAAEMYGDSRIAAVRAVSTLENTITVYRAKEFLDCTGDGWLGYFAGAEYRLGREARGEFDEDLAPEVADTITMSGCLMGDLGISFRSADTGEPTPYEAPPWVPQFSPATLKSRSVSGVTSGNWWLEHDGTIDDLWDPERARDELIRISYGYWNHLKNDWAERDRAATFELAYVPISLAKRESRRLVGDYILNQNDVLGARVFPDRIGYGGWPLDIHHPRGIYSGPEGPFDYNTHVPIYTVPFRCLYSRNIENLLMAGRDMSVSHVALGSVRVQGTLSSFGQAAGTAAAMCVEKGITPRELGRDHIALLQQTLMKHDQYIPEVLNEDPGDLARSATIAASSKKTVDEFGMDEYVHEDSHPLNMSRAVMFPRGEGERIDTIYARLASTNGEPIETTLHLREAGESGDFSSMDDIATVTVAVPPGKEGWVEFEVDCEVDSPFAWLWLPKTEGVEWMMMSKAPLGSCRSYGGSTDGKWTVRTGEYYGFATDPPIALPVEFPPENISNGVTRIVGAAPNMWASDPTQDLPQHVELTWNEPREINAVYLIFDTDMNAKFHTVPIPRESVRDYELSYDDCGEWRSLATETGNFQRRRAHHFEAVTTSKLRLTVTATNGAKSARVFEIRVYNE